MLSSQGFGPGFAGFSVPKAGFCGRNLRMNDFLGRENAL
jgi:hypothetical protein